MTNSTSSCKDALLEMIAARTARVGVIGLGYVGLPLALLFREAGFDVFGFDVDLSKVESLKRGQSYIRHIGPDRVAKAFSNGHMWATTDFDLLGKCDAVVICVPTPLGRHREPDMSFIRATGEEIGRRLRPGQIVVLESTTYPGTTRDELLPRLRKDGLECGRDFFLGFSPEREDPGNRTYSTRSIPKVVSGIDPPSLAVIAALYGATVEKVVPVSSPEVAESAKLMENVFRSVNIALVNELKVVFDRMGIDIWEVIEAAKTKPFGFMPFYPGPGLGGHCIPLDPFYLTWKAAEHGLWARFIELAGEVNTQMPRYVVERAAMALNEQGKATKGAKILVLGLSYKPDIDDDRESPSVELLELFRNLGATVAYCDPYIPVARKGRRNKLDLTSVPCTAEEFARHDALVLSTAHSQFSDAALYRDTPLVVDTRNVVVAGSFPGRLVRA